MDVVQSAYPLVLVDICIKTEETFPTYSRGIVFRRTAQRDGHHPIYLKHKKCCWVKNPPQVWQNSRNLFLNCFWFFFSSFSAALIWKKVSMNKVYYYIVHWTIKSDDQSWAIFSPVEPFCIPLFPKCCTCGVKVVAIFSHFAFGLFNCLEAAVLWVLTDKVKELPRTCIRCC